MLWRATTTGATKSRFGSEWNEEEEESAWPEWADPHDFELGFSVTRTHYVITVDRRPYFNYTHRGLWTAPEQVETVKLSGDGRTTGAGSGLHVADVVVTGAPFVCT
jgi:hypothetical protein